ncbi:MAG: ATP-binding protein [Gemmatimonadota bacterium]
MPNTETIIVVEDDVWVRQIAIRSLRAAGYSVLDACDGQTALTLSDEHAGPIHLVLSDAIMPGMTGATVVERLRQSRPGIKAVFMSGYSGVEVTGKGIDASQVGFVQKPFAIPDLVRIVREQLDTPDPSAVASDTNDDPLRGILADSARLQALRGTDLLDSPSEESFDRLTRLAARFLDVPLAFVVLVDDDRVYFKSVAGRLASGVTQEMRGATLCQGIVASTAPLVVADVAANPALAQLTDVKAIQSRAWLGVPLVVDAYVIGALAIADIEPRQWSADVVTALEDLAAAVMDAINLRTATRRSAEARAALGRASGQLFLAKNSAEVANRSKEEFLTRMNHELRTPLNSIIGFTNVLRRNSANALGNRELQYLERIGVNSVQLLELVDRILDLSKIAYGELRVRYSWVHIDEVCRSVCDEFADRAREAGLSLEFQLEPSGENAKPCTPIHTDESKLRQILINLVGNAVKFTPSGGKVVIVLVCDASSGAPMRLDIRDNGIGIAPEARARVFEAFEQAEDDTGARFGGTGVGLRISRALCESLGFELTLESEPGKGSTFSVVFGTMA